MNKRYWFLMAVLTVLTPLTLTGCGSKSEGDLTPNGSVPKAAPADMKPMGTTSSGAAKGTGSQSN